MKQPELWLAVDIQEEHAAIDKRKLTGNSVVLAIDPGTRESGMVLWNGQKVIETGVLPNDSMIEAIPRLLAAGAEILAIENVGHYGTDALLKA